MDFLKRKADLEVARDQTAARLNAIYGQLQLVNEILAEEAVEVATAEGLGLSEESTEEPKPNGEDKSATKLDS